MIYRLTLSSNADHDIMADATARYVDNGIGSYEYWGARGVDSRIEFECEIGEVKMCLRTGSRTRKITPTEAQLKEMEQQVKEIYDDHYED